MGPESKIKCQIVQWLKQRGYYVFPVQDRFRHGTLDLFVAGHGRCAWVEVKGPGGRLSRLQEIEVDALRAHWCGAVVARSVDDIVDFFTI